MGSWGPGVFQDDVAVEVRAEYVELREEGLTPAAATRQLVDGWSDALEDADDGPTFWLALAATQSERGELVASVKRRALKALEAGAAADLARRAPASRAKRRKVLVALAAQLNGPQPEPAKPTPGPRRPTPAPEVYLHPPWEVGDVVAYRLPSGRPCLLRVLGHLPDPAGKQRKRGAAPHPDTQLFAVEVLDWTGEDASTLRPAELSALPSRRGLMVMTFGIAFVGQAGAAALERFQHVARGLPKRPFTHAPGLLTSQQLNEHLRFEFDLQ